jgi:hypothetical protein
MYKLLLDPIFDRGLRNHNEFESLFPLLHFLVHPGDPITPTWLPMVKIMHVDNISVLNAAILPILNGTVPFTNVEHVEKQHQDMCHELVMDVSMMMEILPENVDLH